MANAMSNVLTADKKRLVVQISMYDSQRELDQIRQIDPSTCDGLFICSTHSSGKDIRSAAGDLPVLMFDDMSTDPEACYDSIETPSQTGMYAAIKHLAERERKTIGIVGTLGKSAEAEHSLSVTLRQTRYAYAYQALGAYGLNTDNAYIQSDWSVEAGIEVAHKLAASGMQYADAVHHRRGFRRHGANRGDDDAATDRTRRHRTKQFHTETHYRRLPAAQTRIHHGTHGHHRLHHQDSYRSNHDGR